MTFNTFGHDKSGLLLHVERMRNQTWEILEVAFYDPNFTFATRRSTQPCKEFPEREPIGRF